MHAVQHPAMDWFEPVTHIGKGTGNDHGHRIVDVGRFQLVFDIYRYNSKIISHI